MSFSLIFTSLKNIKTHKILKFLSNFLPILSLVLLIFILRIFSIKQLWSCPKNGKKFLFSSKFTFFIPKSIDTPSNNFKIILEVISWGNHAEWAFKLFFCSKISNKKKHTEAVQKIPLRQFPFIYSFRYWNEESSVAQRNKGEQFVKGDINCL